MTKRTRVFVLGASAFLLVGVASAGVASYVGLAGINALGSAAELSYVPSGSQLIASLDVRHLVDSELGKKVLASGKGAPADLLAETGIDIYKDVDSVIVAASTDNLSQPHAAPLALVRGRFDESKIEAAIVAKGGSADQHLGVRTVMTEQIGVAFLEQGLIAAGSPASIRQALETGLNGGPSIKSNDEAMRLVGRVDGGDTWVVAKFDALQTAPPFPQQVAQQLPSITWFAASGQVDSGISARIHAEAKDDQAAKDLQDVVRGLVALARMQVGQMAGLTDVINSIELSGEGNTVSLGFSVPAQTIDTIIKTGENGARTPAAFLLPQLQPSARRSLSNSPSI